MRARVFVAAAILAVAIGAAAEEPKRYEGPYFTFDYPARAKAAPSSDPTAEGAVTISDKNITAVVLAGQKRVADSELESTASAWHAARMKNRAAWGVHTDGGPPHDSVRIGDKRWMRWRDHVGSVLGAKEQSMTCGGINGHLGCVVVSAPEAAREAADALAAELLKSFVIHRPR
jgi:hypothetical protein